MKYFSETRLYCRRSISSIWREDEEARTPKHEISENTFNMAINVLYKDVKPLKNSDGSITFASILNSNESTETTFYIEN